jgi:hypothetical protein
MKSREDGKAVKFILSFAAKIISLQLPRHTSGPCILKMVMG